VSEVERSATGGATDAPGGSNSLRYVVVTPAYNEAEYIGRTIDSVVAQTVLPDRWVIVDDGSTDGTAEIIQARAAACDFIRYLRRTRDPAQTYFGSNVLAIREGYQQLGDQSFEFFCVLDADMELCRDYYEQILRRFAAYPELGIATGTYVEKIGNRLIEAQIDRRSTPKALQVFRRECYEQLGGYIACRHGGEDTCAEIMARMHGWQTWSFPEIVCHHQRPVGTGGGRSLLWSRYSLGLREYYLGTHPLFLLFKCLRRSLIERPYVLSGLARLAGFLRGYLSGKPRNIPAEAMAFVRREQKARLWRCLGVGPRLWQPTPGVAGGQQGGR
jgi:biofilm PGA synthesis N-glycosyltransferase PgaC